MQTFLIGLAIAAAVAAVPVITHFISYRLLKERTIRSRTWDLNICCGKTDGGGVNADIVRHAEVPNFVLVEDIYRLPFADKQFDWALCSHTMEHVEDPARFFAELRRVARHVQLILPPLWDPGAALDVLEHRWLFLTCRKNHTSLPRMVRLPFARALQRRRGQKIKA